MSDLAFVLMVFAFIVAFGVVTYSRLFPRPAYGDSYRSREMQRIVVRPCCALDD